MRVHERLALLTVARREAVFPKAGEVPRADLHAQDALRIRPATRGAVGYRRHRHVCVRPVACTEVRHADAVGRVRWDVAQIRGRVEVVHVARFASGVVVPQQLVRAVGLALPYEVAPESDLWAGVLLVNVSYGSVVRVHE